MFFQVVFMQLKTIYNVKRIFVFSQLLYAIKCNLIFFMRILIFLAITSNEIHLINISLVAKKL